MTLTKTQRRRLVALSSIVGIMIGIGITVAAGGTLFYTFQSQTDPFTTSSSLEVRNLNAVLKDDILQLTATVKNSGQTSITSLFIESVSVTDLTISQDKYGILEVKGTPGTKYFCNAVVATAGGVQACKKIDDSRGFSISTDGVNTGTTISLTESTLEGGRTNALVLKIESSGTPDISDDINISDKLNLVLPVHVRSGRAAYRRLHDTSKARLDRCRISSFFCQSQTKVYCYACRGMDPVYK